MIIPSLRDGIIKKAKGMKTGWNRNWNNELWKASNMRRSY
jgi:hypothetical protein